MLLPSSSAPAVNRNAILAIILISYVMIVLDISVVLTGLPKIQHQLGFSESNLAWVSSAYTLTFGGFLLLGARAGDILGRRRMFVIGLAIFTLASLAIGVSQSAGWMLTWRAIQGIGAAVLAPSTLALLQTNFPEGHERTRAISYYAAAAGLSATVGLSVLVAAAAIGSGNLTGRDLMAHRVSMAFDAATVMLAISFLVVLVAIVLPRKAGFPPDSEQDEITATGPAEETARVVEAA